MTDEEFAAAKKTFPWTPSLLTNGLGGQYYLHDKSGKEVPIDLMLGVLNKLTHHIAKPVATTQPEE